jgi:DNA adenine methylase Dam
LFPDNINTFVDLFGGGCNVAINVKAKQIIYNEIITQVVEMLKYFKNNTLELQLQEIDVYINKYNLSKTNQEGFNQLREYYNKKDKSPITLYTIISHAFNYQIRFNQKGEYNMPFGKNRSYFSQTLRDKFISFVNEIHKKNIIFSNIDFKDLKLNNINQNDFIYFDPPYLNTTATYNENGGWNQENENALLDLLINLDNKGIKWALSNNISINTKLKDWVEQHSFNIHYLNNTYNNSNYQKKDKMSKDIEVLITNYKLS